MLGNAGPDGQVQGFWLVERRNWLSSLWTSSETRFCSQTSEGFGSGFVGSRLSRKQHAELSVCSFLLTLRQCCGVFGQSGSAGPIRLVVVFSFISATPRKKNPPPHPRSFETRGKRTNQRFPVAGTITDLVNYLEEEDIFFCFSRWSLPGRGRGH